jgi:uncharacterized protein (TIGR02246 family)
LIDAGSGRLDIEPMPPFFSRFCGRGGRPRGGKSKQRRERVISMLGSVSRLFTRGWQRVGTILFRAPLWAATLVLGLSWGGAALARAQSAARRPVGAVATSATPAPGAADADKAIRAAAAQFVVAFNKHDPKAVAALWAVDGDYLDESGTLSTGREAIEKYYADVFATDPAATIAITVDAVRFLGADTAVEDGSASVTATPHAAPILGRYTVVHVKRDGAWRMASVRELKAESAAATDPMEDLAWMVGSWRAEHLGAEMEIDVRWLANKAFVEATYSQRVGETSTPTATQIIGINPGTGRIMSWMFSGDRGVATGDWTSSNAGWSIDYQGVRGDGAPTTAVNLLFRQNDALVWKSTNRNVAGVAIPDTEEVVLKRK